MRVGMVGFGGLGRVHYDSLKEIENASVTAICDACADQFENIESNCNTYIYLADMLDNETLDCVVISTPTDTHADIAIAAMDAGISVLCEKPMALTLENCERMIAARDRNNVQLMIAQCIRFWPEYEHLRESITDGRFGRLISIYMERVGGYAQPETAWFNDHRRSGGAILDLHVHDVDWARDVLGAPDAIFAAGSIGKTGGVDDVSAIWSYKDGPVVTIRSSWMCQSGFNMAYSAFFDGATLNYSSGGGLSVSGADIDLPEMPANSAYVAEMQYFLDCVAGRYANEKCSAESSMASIEMAHREIEIITARR